MTLLDESFEDVSSLDLPATTRTETRPPHRAVTPSHVRSPIVGENESLVSVMRQADRVAVTDSTVLILGETGTGKELLAEHLHRASARAAGPFVAINVAAIPATLLESELFGRERGAYTGAMTRQIGRFEAADHGTLFLDEIGELPVETQVKLLRVLECGQIERLGSSRTFRVNVRVIAATNRRLPDLIRAGTFRQDLFYRLNVFPLTMPPLRDRPTDIPALVWAFINEFSFKMGKPVERVREGDIESLRTYRWPGNIRELRNAVERAMILGTGPELRIDVPESDSGDDPACITAASRRLRDVENAHIRSVLRSTHDRIRGKGGAAEILGLKPTTLYSCMRRLGIERPAPRPTA
ncbi:MAG: sigma-54 interaction domain-containing protein [Phycisphaerae bacterium]